MTDLLRAVLATWRLTSLLVYEDGPLAVFAQLRAAAPGEIRRALNCAWCTSLWAALALLIARKAGCGALEDALAASAGAILIDEAVNWVKGSNGVHKNTDATQP